MLLRLLLVLRGVLHVLHRLLLVLPRLLHVLHRLLLVLQRLLLVLPCLLSVLQGLLLVLAGLLGMLERLLLVLVGLLLVLLRLLLVLVGLPGVLLRFLLVMLSLARVLLRLLLVVLSLPGVLLRLLLVVLSLAGVLLRLLLVMLRLAGVLLCLLLVVRRLGGVSLRFVLVVRGLRRVLLRLRLVLLRARRVALRLGLVSLCTDGEGLGVGRVLLGRLDVRVRGLDMLAGGCRVLLGLRFVGRCAVVLVLEQLEELVERLLDRAALLRAPGGVFLRLLRAVGRFGGSFLVVGGLLGEPRRLLLVEVGLLGGRVCQLCVVVRALRRSVGLLRRVRRDLLCRRGRIGRRLRILCCLRRVLGGRLRRRLRLLRCLRRVIGGGLGGVTGVLGLPCARVRCVCGVVEALAVAIQRVLEREDLVPKRRDLGEEVLGLIACCKKLRDDGVGVDGRALCRAVRDDRLGHELEGNGWRTEAPYEAFRVEAVEWRPTSGAQSPAPRLWARSARAGAGACARATLRVVHRFSRGSAARTRSCTLLHHVRVRVRS